MSHRQARNVCSPITIDGLREKVARLSKESGIEFKFIPSAERHRSRGYKIIVEDTTVAENLPIGFRNGELGKSRGDANRILDAMLAGISMGKNTN